MLRGNSAASRDIAFHLHPYTHLKKHESEGPLVITEGKGVHVYDENGKEYIEGLAGLWCTSLGFSEERLVQAATRQMQRLPFFHIFNHKTHDVAAELAERLIGMMPVKMSKVFFNNSGSEANDSAIKMVWYYNNARGRHRKKKIIARMKGYHGVTVAAASLTGLPNNHRDFDLPIAQIRHADCPHYYRFAKPGESEEAFATRLAESLEAQILREDPDTVAAFIAEPVMGAGGVILPPRTYFEKVQKVLKKYDVLLIADEVICGFGRTGNMFGSETYGLAPDIMTMAKALSSAYLPISATIINDEIYQAFVAQSEKIGVFAHGFTYSAHPVCCAVALETLKIYEERDILGHVRKVSPRLLDGLRRTADHPLVGELRGVGLLAGVELVKDKATKAPFDPKAGVGAIFAARAQEHGLILRAMGDTVALCPPLIITAEETDEMLRRFGKALDDTAAALDRAGLAPVA
ncbi:MAG TPA: aspartate aminotransferase family protein [Stellaceae bacterium]|nr:aspartate aminotransferase family protein [Stellaceae bacterium]